MGAAILSSKFFVLFPVSSPWKMTFHFEQQLHSARSDLIQDGSINYGNKSIQILRTREMNFLSWKRHLLRSAWGLKGPQLLVGKKVRINAASFSEGWQSHTIHICHPILLSCISPFNNRLSARRQRKSSSCDSAVSLDWSYNDATMT